MQLNIRWIWALIAVATVGIAGGYAVGVKMAGAPATSSSDVTTSAGQRGDDSTTAITDQLPAGHVPVTRSIEFPALATGHPTTGDAEPKHPGLQFTHFRVGNRNIKTMLNDGPVLWVGTSGGVVRYDTGSDQYRLFDVHSGLLSNGVFHLSKLAQKLVVGTYGGGLSLYDSAEDTWEHFNIQHGLGDPFIYDVLQASNGDIWIATWSGANRVRGGDLGERSQWDLFTVENTGGGLPNDWVYGLAEGTDGEVWLATEGGLARFKDEGWQNWDHADGLGAEFDLVGEQLKGTYDPATVSSHHARQKVEQGLGAVDVAYNPNYIVSLLVDDDGIVWCGTWGGGLARFDGETWQNLTVADGLPANHVLMLERDPRGTMWIGTSRGLARAAGDGFEVYTVADGLFAENVFSMAVDATGTMWVGSYGGVARIAGLVDSL